MNDERRKLLTKFLGERWAEIVISPYRSDGTAEDKNRIFATWPDLGAVKEKLVEWGEWKLFLDYVGPRWIKVEGVNHKKMSEFTAWFFTPARFCELAAEFLEERQERT